MLILLTGAGGFIPSHVAEALLAEGHTVRALVHYNGRGAWGHLQHLAGGSDHLSGQLEVHLGDVTDTFQMQRLAAGCDAVIHMAALIGIPYSYIAPASYLVTNAGGSLNILEAARSAKVQRVILTSTSEVYGTARYTPIDEGHPLQAQSPYSASKIAADKLGEAYFRSFDLPVVVLRPFNTYGPRQSARAVIPTILAQILSGAHEIVLGNMNALRDLTFVEDSARAFVLALTTPGIAGEVIHFGQGEAVSIADLAQLCLDTAGDLIPSDAPVYLRQDSGRMRPEKSEVQLLLCNPARAHSLLGWQPRVPLKEGLRKTALYIRDHLTEFAPLRYSI
jgi:NAD dependent epimerase/dehydratase